MVGALASPAAALDVPPLTGRIVDNAHLLPADRTASLSAELATHEAWSAHWLRPPPRSLPPPSPAARLTPPTSCLRIVPRRCPRRRPPTRRAPAPRERSCPRHPWRGNR